MKRSTLFRVLMFLLVSIPVAANPLPVPQAIISEFMFESNGRWIMEVGFVDNTYYRALEFDSICISSLAGRSRIPLGGLSEGESLFIIASDSLVVPLAIDPNGDRIRLYSYTSHYFDDSALVDSVTFGNVVNPMFETLQPGYSISWSPPVYRFVKDRTPTIGAVNDTSGTLGTLHGRIFDIQNREVHQGELLLDNPISFHTDGTFTTRVYSRTQTFSWLMEHIVDWRYQTLPIQPFTVTMEPDSTVEMDIHLLVEHPDGIQDDAGSDGGELSLIAYPNPFNTATNFSLELPRSIRFLTAGIEIYNIAGQKIKDIAVAGTSAVRWDGTNSRGEIQSTGVYYYRLVLDHRVRKEGSVILLK